MLGRLNRDEWAALARGAACIAITTTAIGALDLIACWLVRIPITGPLAAVAAAVGLTISVLEARRTPWRTW